MDFVEALNEKSTQWQSVDELLTAMNSASKKLGYFIRSFIPFKAECRVEVEKMVQNE